MGWSARQYLLLSSCAWVSGGMCHRPSYRMVVLRDLPDYAVFEVGSTGTCFLTLSFGVSMILGRDMAKKPKKRTPKRYTYNPIVCKKCGEEIFQELTVLFDAPLGWNDFTKHALRMGAVKVKGVLWEAAVWRCGCGIKSPEIRDERPGRPYRKKRRPDPNERPFD